MAGIAIVMIASQLGKTTGVAVQGDEFISTRYGLSRLASGRRIGRPP